MKISHDPNNTAWSRFSARFGQKLLLSHGWTPGSSLGVSGAPYANHPAGSSRVRIIVKDDNLGLGARTGARDDVGLTIGLDGLQHLLGRLNGKDARMLEKEQQGRENTKRALYAERRWGLGNFVSGGFLVGDRIQHGEDVPLDSFDAATTVGVISPSIESPRRVHKPKKEKSKKARESRTAYETSKDACGVDDGQDGKRLGTAKDATLEAERCLEKMERKSQRRARKAERAAATALGQTRQAPVDTAKFLEKTEKQALAAPIRLPEEQKAHGRHAVRQRFIQHKKMCLTNEKALNEVRCLRRLLFHC